MCVCTPTIRTPWCGQPGCIQPGQIQIHYVEPLLVRLGLVGVKQTILGRGPDFGEPPGNCMQAALATVLGRRLQDVPHFLEHGDADWWEQMNDWLLEHHQVALIGLAVGDWHVPRVLHLMQGLTVRDTKHVVVGYAGEQVWDPHPSDDGLVRVDNLEVFVSQRPSR